MKILNLSGSHYDIGQQYGRMLKGSFTPLPASKKKIEFTKECEKLAKQYTPDIIDELEGFSSASELDGELVKAFILTLGLEPGCTVFALSSEETINDNPIFARNYDWDAEFQKYFTPANISPRNQLGCLCFSDHFIGAYGGVNEKGLAAAVTAIPAYTGSPKPGIRMNIALRWILNNLKTTEEAAEWMKKTPHQWAHNFVIADKNGNLARVETSPERTEAKYPVNFVASTNHYHDSQMKTLENPTFDYTNTHTRYRRVEEWYRRRKPMISLEDVKHVLSDHEVGVCDHGVWDGREAGTIWSWIAPLGQRKVYVSPGPPCQNEYTSVEF